MRPKNHTGPAAAAGAVVRLPDRRGLCQRAGGAAVFHRLRAGAGAVRRGAGLRPAGRGRRGNAVGRRAGRRLHPLVRPAAGQAAGMGVAGGAVRRLHRHAGGGRGAAAKRVRPACRGGPRGDVRCRAGHRAGRPGPHDRYPGPRRPADRRLLWRLPAWGRCCAAPPGSLCPPCPRRRPAAGGPPALVYAGYNLYLLAPFLQALAGGCPAKKPARRAAWLGCGIFGAALALLHLAFCLAPESLADPAPHRRAGARAVALGGGRRGAGAAGRRLHHRRAAAVWHLRGAARPPGPQPRRRAGGRAWPGLPARPLPFAPAGGCAVPGHRLAWPDPCRRRPSPPPAPKSLPCKAQTEGCIAALTHGYPSSPGRALPRVRRGRCLHRPTNPAMPQGRKGIGRTRRSTPQSAGADSSPCRGAFWVKTVCKASPCKGRWMHRKAQTEGGHCRFAPQVSFKPRQGLPRVRRGRCSHRPANPAMPQTPCGGRKRPALQSPCKRVVTQKAAAFARPAGGPMKSSAPTQGCAFQRKQFAGQP